MLEIEAVRKQERDNFEQERNDLYSQIHELISDKEKM